MSRFILPIQSAYDSNGKPLNGAKLYFYEVGTSTPKDTYSDEALTTVNTNPVVADASGRFGDIYLSGQYDATLKDSLDVTIWGAEKTTSMSLFGDSILTFDTVAAMVASKALSVGDIVETAGYYAAGDGGGAKYQIVAATTGTDDGGSFINLDTHQAKLLSSGATHVKQFGAKGDGINDDTAAIQAAIDYSNTLGVLDDASGGQEVHIDVGQYMISNTLTLYGGFGGEERVSLIGKGSGSTTLKLADESLCDMIKYNSTDGFNHCRVEGILLDGNRDNQTQPTLTVTGITQANPAVVTYTGTQPSNGDLFAITGVSGMTEINTLHSTIANVTATTFELDLINSSTFSAYTSGGTATQKFRGIYARQAYSGSRFTDLKINDIAGVAIDCEEVSNGPLMDNVGVTRAGTHALWIHDSNNDGFLVRNMEVGTAGEDGIGYPFYIYNVTAAGHGNFIFDNCRHDNGGATQTPQSEDMLVVEETAVSIVMLSPRVRAQSTVSATYNMVKLNRNAAPYIIIHGYAFDAAPSSVTQNIINDTVNSKTHTSTTSEPVVYWNCPIQHVDLNSTDLHSKYFKTGDSQPRFALAPIGPYWGSGSGTPDIRIQRDSSSSLRIANSSSTEQGLRISNLVTVGGSVRMDEISAPTGATDKGFLYCKDNGSGKTQLCCKLGDNVEIVLATQA